MPHSRHSIESQQWRAVEFRLPAGMFCSVREHMLSDQTREQFGIILASHNFAEGHLRLLARAYLKPTAKDLDYAHYTGIRTTRQYNNAVLKRAVEDRLSLIHVHSHPFTDQNVSFSGIDDHSEREEATWLHQHFPSVMLGSIVMGQSSLEARVWNTAHDNIKPIGVDRLTAMEFPLLLLNRGEFGCIGTPVSTGRPVDDWATRQVQAFGSLGQARIELLTVGIVGLGGLGSLLAEGIARLGVRRFVLIDPDRVDETNRNRLLGLTERDVGRQAFKVRIARRELHRVSSDIHVSCFRVDAATRSAAAALKRCDLVIAATDNHYSRLFLQRLTQQYLIPMVNTGVAITTELGRIQEVFGGTQLLLPGAGNPCLVCSRHISLQTVSEELASPALRIEMKQRGYLDETGIPTPSVRPLNAVTANLALSIIHNFLSGYGTEIRSVSYNMLAQSLEQYEYSIDADCRICGARGVTGMGDSLRLDYYIRPAGNGSNKSESEDCDESLQSARR